MTKPKTDKQLRILEEAREKAKLVLEEKRKIMEREKEQEKERIRKEKEKKEGIKSMFAQMAARGGPKRL